MRITSKLNLQFFIKWTLKFKKSCLTVQIFEYRFYNKTKSWPPQTHNILFIQHPSIIFERYSKLKQFSLIMGDKYVYFLIIHHSFLNISFFENVTVDFSGFHIFYLKWYERSLYEFLLKLNLQFLHKINFNSEMLSS